MFLKIFKYDMKNIGRVLFPLYAITLFACGLTRLLSIFDDLVLMQVLSFLTNVSAIFLMIATLVLTLFMCVKRFYTNLFKDEGYLTNVLPVKLETHIISKVVCSLIFNTIAIIVFVSSFAIMYYSIELVESMTIIIEALKEFIPMAFIASVLSLQSYEMLICTAYAFGQRRNKSKILYSVLYGIGLYYIPQIISLIGMGIVLLIKNDFIELLGLLDMDTFRLVFIMGNICSVLGCVIYYLLTRWSLNSKMDLE
jgi:hypothetical protein